MNFVKYLRTVFFLYHIAYYYIIIIIINILYPHILIITNILMIAVVNIDNDFLIFYSLMLYAHLMYIFNII